MKQCFCDACGKQTYEDELGTIHINGYSVDLCYKCQDTFGDQIDHAQRKVEIEFMKTMKHQPLGFKYYCE